MNFFKGLFVFIELQKEEEGKRELPSIDFTAQMATVVKAGPGQTQDLETSPGFPMWVAGAQMLGPSSTVFPRPGVTRWEVECMGTSQCPYGMLVTYVTNRLFSINFEITPVKCELFLGTFFCLFFVVPIVVL